MEGAGTGVSDPVMGTGVRVTRVTQPHAGTRCKTLFVTISRTVTKELDFVELWLTLIGCNKLLRVARIGTAILESGYTFSISRASPSRSRSRAENCIE